MADTAVNKWRVPTLYASSKDDFSTEGIGPLTGIISGTTHNELNEMPTIEFRYAANDELAQYLANDRVVTADVGPHLRNQLFHITQVDRHNAEYVDVKANHILDDLYYNTITPLTLKSVRVLDALAAWKGALVDPMPQLLFQSDIDTVINVNWTLENQSNAKFALGGANGSLLQTLKGEYQFDNFKITYNRSIGQALGQTIEYGKNLLSVDESEIFSDVYTAIQPFAKIQIQGVDGQQDTEQTITLPENTIKADGWDQFERPRIKVVDLSEYKVSDAASLRKVAQAYMNDNDFGKPNRNIKVEHAQMTDELAFLETSNVGDTANVYFPQAHIDTTAEVVSTDWDWLLHEYTATELGWRKTTGGSMLDKYKKDTEQQVSQVSDKVDQETQDRQDADKNLGEDLTDTKNEWDKKWESVDEIKTDVRDLNRDVTNYIKSGGQGIIQFLPNRENPTSMRINSSSGGYFLLNDDGLGYFDTNGAKVAIDNRGNVVASVIAASTKIESPNIIGGTITAASIVNGDFRTQDTYGNETHVSAQGITTANFVQAPVFYLPGSSGVWTLRPAGNRLVANSPADGKDYVVAGPAW